MLYIFILFSNLIYVVKLLLTTFRQYIIHHKYNNNPLQLIWFDFFYSVTYYSYLFIMYFFRYDLRQYKYLKNGSVTDFFFMFIVINNKSTNHNAKWQPVGQFDRYLLELCSKRTLYNINNKSEDGNFHFHRSV